MYNSKWMHIFQILLGLNYFSWKHSVQKCYPVPTWGIRTNSNKMSYSNPQVYHPPLTSFFLSDILRNLISTHLNGWIVASWKMATIHPARTDFYEWTKKIKKKKKCSQLSCSKGGSIPSPAALPTFGNLASLGLNLKSKTAGAEPLTGWQHLAPGGFALGPLPGWSAGAGPCLAPRDGASRGSAGLSLQGSGLDPTWDVCRSTVPPRSSVFLDQNHGFLFSQLILGLQFFIKYLVC